MGITNEPTITDSELTNSLRSAIEHRATWMALMMQAAKKAGLDPEEFTREAITKCGCFHGKGLLEEQKGEGFEAFKEVFIPQKIQDIFEMDVVRCDDEELYIEFHYCPLVNAWLKQGCSKEEIELMCDCAMDGDRGIAQACDFGYELGETIAKGNKVCQVTFRKKK